MVNTFITCKPDVNFHFLPSARKLNRQRLFKQIIEARYVLDVLTGKSKKKGYNNHPIMKMWHGYLPSLRQYINDHITAYKERKKKNGDYCSTSIQPYELSNYKIVHPWWTSCDYIIFSHKASLLRKERMRYEEPWYWTDDDFLNIPPEWLNYGYIWTCNLDDHVRSQLKENPSMVIPADVCSPVKFGIPLKRKTLKQRTKNFTHTTLFHPDFIYKEGAFTYLTDEIRKSLPKNVYYFISLKPLRLVISGVSLTVKYGNSIQILNPAVKIDMSHHFFRK